MWWKCYSGGTNFSQYVNSELCRYVRVRQESTPSGWVVDVIDNGGGTTMLDGVHASRADAEEVMRKLVQGFDPSSLV